MATFFESFFLLFLKLPLKLEDVNINIETVKERFFKHLETHRISDKLFCKAVLNSTTKVIKRLFALNMPINLMKPKDKVIILKINMWLNDPHGMKKLRDWTNSIKSRLNLLHLHSTFVFFFINLATELLNDNMMENDGEEVISLDYDLNATSLPGMILFK